MPYKLSATLVAHSKDVRALASPTNDLVLSASRDTTAISWKRDDAGAGFSPSTVFHPGAGYISAVAYVPASADAPQGYAVTGGQDSVINVYNIAAGRDDPDLTLIGHKQNVCALQVGEDGTLISGSWDGTAKVWKNFQEVYELKGHHQAVWAVMPLTEDRYLTGSADKTLRLWHGAKCERTYSGHKDVVRGIALITDIGFASCANSGDIILWTLDGDMVHTLSGHTSFVYALSVLPSGDLVSAGEDRTVRVWHDFECAQTIVHPAISVWTVSTMPNGDIVSGCSDGVIRVFSESKDRWASANDLKEYDDQVASQARPSQEMENLKTADAGVLSKPGTKPGQTVIVANSSGVKEAHQWDAGSGQWQKIGEVVNAVGEGQRKIHDGKEYDYVFDIDVQEGAPPLKLPYNVNENPYSSAQRFLERHELPMAYIDQVVDFITKNTQGETLGGGGNQYVDPYTGASRYQSSAASVPTAGSSRGDPYTGGGRYQPQGAASSDASSGYRDPYTGASRYTPGGQPAARAPPPPVPTTGVLPVRQYLTFKQAKVLQMRDKLSDISDSFKNEISTSHLAIYPNEIHRFEEMVVTLDSAVGGEAPTRDALTWSHLETVLGVLERWPADPRWPLIDLARLLIGFFPHVFKDDAARRQVVNALFAACSWSDGFEGGLDKSRLSAIAITFRTISNAYQTGSPKGDFHYVLQKLSQLRYQTLGKAQRQPLATLLYDFSVLALETPSRPETRALHLRVLFEILTQQPDPDDMETPYRALVALGNIIYAARTQNNPLSQTEANQAKMAYAFARGVGQQRFSDIASDIQALLTS